MKSLATIFQCLRHAWKGKSLSDKYLAFFLAGLGQIGNHRRGLRNWWMKRLNSFCGRQELSLSISHLGTAVTFLIRGNNEADYLMAGEFIRGSYPKPSGTPSLVVDGGANIGMFSIHAACCFPNTRIIAFEPDPDNFRMLEKNMKLNGFSVKMFPKALWSSECTLYYHIRSSCTGFISTEPSVRPISCTVPPLEDNCWMKLDVEGAEYEILPALFERGQHPRYLSMEIHEFNRRGDSLMALMKNHGYIIADTPDGAASCVSISASRKNEGIE